MRKLSGTIRACGIAIILLLAVGACAAQKTSNNSNTPNSNESAKVPSPEGLEKGLPPDPSGDSSTGNTSRAIRLLAPPSSNIQFDDASKASYQKAIQSYYAYLQIGFEHRKNAFAWQLLSSQIIFFTVIVLVLSGVYFSGIQFHRSLRAQRAQEVESKKKAQDLKKPADVGDEADDAKKLTDSTAPESEFPITQLEASLQGIKVSSPVLGVIILALSFLFFYMYIRYVYPVNEISF